jgi:hypothetical protein
MGGNEPAEANNDKASYLQDNLELVQAWLYYKVITPFIKCCSVL